MGKGGKHGPYPPGAHSHGGDSQAYTEGVPGGSVGKNPPANAGDSGLISGSGRSPREGNATLSSILA